MSEKPTQEIIRKPTGELQCCSNIRTGLGGDDELRRLGKSLRQGQHMPLLILADGIIVDGHRRHAAALMEGIEYLDCIVVPPGTTPGQCTVIQWAIAIQGKDISPYDKAEAARSIEAAHPDMTRKALADGILLVDAGYLTKLLTLWDCIPEVQEAARAGKIGISDWYAISKAPGQLAALALKLNGATRDELQRHNHRNGNAKAATVKARSIPVMLRSGIAVTFKGESITLTQALDALADIKQELKDAIDSDHDAKTFAALMKKRARELTRHTAKAGGAA